MDKIELNEDNLIEMLTAYETASAWYKFLPEKIFTKIITRVVARKVNKFNDFLIRFSKELHKTPTT